MDEEAGQWLTYTQLAELRGIGRPSAVKLALRSQWRRQKGNDGEARVYVPGTFLQPARNASREPSHEASSEALSRITKSFDAALATLREQLDRAHADIVSLKDRAVAAEARATQAEAARVAVEADADQWWRQGRWARVRKAWRGRGQGKASQ